MEATTDCPSRGANQLSHKKLSRLEKIALEYPALFPFGVDLHEYLSAEGERTADLPMRLRSSWRYMISRVNRFVSTMDAREQASIDVEDIVQSIVLRLCERDHHWDPDQGRYSTFVEVIIQNVLSSVHESARPISGPTNSFSRMKVYREREAEGTLTRGMRQTMRSIERVMGQIESLDENWMSAAEENGEHVHHDLVGAIKSIRDPLKTWIFISFKGLFGQRKMTMKSIARELGMSDREVRGICKDAFERVQGYLLKHHEVNGESLCVNRQ